MGDVRSELIQVISDEFNEAGITNTVIQPTVVLDGLPSPMQMLVELGPDRLGRTPIVHVFFLPQLDDPPVVQYTVFFEFDVMATAASDLARFIMLLNSNLVITGYEFNETLGQVVFRHTQSVGTAPLDPSVIAWPLMMIRAAVDNFSALVDFVAMGGQYDRAAELLSATFQRIAHHGADSDGAASEPAE